MKINQLTGLRFIAALAVFFSHLGWDPSESLVGRLFEQGFVGVSFFFVLSGFVLSHSYKQRLKDDTISIKSYYLLRLARVGPLHLATALPYFALLYDDNWRAIFGGVMNILLLQSWLPHSGIYFSLNAPSWSLSNEVFFYLVFGFLVVLSDKNLLRVFFALALGVIFGAFWATVSFENYVFMGSRSISHWLFYIFPLFRLLEFICGMLLYNFWYSGLAPRRSFFIISFFLLVTAMFFGAFVPEAFRYSLFYLPFICFLLFSSLRGDAFGVRWLSARWAIFLGKISFAFYLLHLNILSMIYNFYKPDEVGVVLYALISLIIIAIASIAAYYLLERPAETFLRKKILVF